MDDDLFKIITKSKEKLGVIDIIGNINNIVDKRIIWEELRLEDLGKTAELTINSVKVIFSGKAIQKYNPLEPQYINKIIATIYLNEYNKGNLELDSGSVERLKSKIE